MVADNEIPKGFQKTKIGIIPSDWQVKKLVHIAEICTGSTPPTKDRNNYGDEYLFVSPSDLGKEKIIRNTEKKLSAKGFNISRKFPKNSILFTCIGSTIGKCGISDRELTSNQQINAIFANSTFNTDYLYYTLNLLTIKIKKSAGETAVPKLIKLSLVIYIYLFPPPKPSKPP